MAQQLFRPIETSIGILQGRDAIYLDALEFASHNILKLTGEINGNLASTGRDRFIKYSLTFSGVIVFKVIELDSWDYQFASSFDEIVDSEWCKALGGKITANHRHYQVQTYDHVIDVVAEKFSLLFEDQVLN